MEKIGIITIIDNDNYGNRLQNYACYYLLSKYDKTFNIVRRYGCEFRDFGVNHRFFIVRKLKRLYRFLCEMVCFNKYTKNRIKLFNFKKFNKLIKNGDVIFLDGSTSAFFIFSILHKHSYWAFKSSSIIFKFSSPVTILAISSKGVSINESASFCSNKSKCN